MASNSDSGSSSAVAKELRRLKPVALRVELHDGSVREVAIGGRRNKWSNCMATLSQLPWVQAEALDPKSRLIGVVVNDQAEAEDEDIFEDSPVTGDLKALLSLMLKGQDVALRRNADQTKQLTDTVLKLADVLMTRLVSLERSYMNNLKLVQQFAAQGGAGSGEDLMSTEAIGALMPVIAMKLMGGDPKALLAGMAEEQVKEAAATVVEGAAK